MKVTDRFVWSNVFFVPFVVGILIVKIFILLNLISKQAPTNVEGQAWRLLI